MSASGPASRPPGLVIFDCDGVLVDSEPLANRLFVEHLCREGFPVTLAEAHRDLVGRSMAACIAHLESRFGRPLPAGFVSRLQEATFEAFRRELRAVPGVAEVLANLEVPVCVASSGEPEKMRLTLGLTGLLDRFDGNLFSATQVARGKPAPDLFLFAAREMGVPPAACVVVEDSLPGVQAARAAGMRALGYAGGGHSDPGALAAAGATVFGDMRELPPLLRV